MRKIKFKLLLFLLKNFPIPVLCAQISSFWEEDEFYKEIFISFIKKGPSKVFGENNFMIKINHENNTYKEYMNIEKFSPFIEKVCEELKEGNAVSLRKTLEKYKKSELFFLGSLLVFGDFSFNKLRKLKNSDSKNEENVKREIEKIASELKNCELDKQIS